MVGQDSNDNRGVMVEEGDDDILKATLLWLPSEEDCPEAPAESVGVGPKANAETSEVLVLLLLEQR
jgi:hypothetical protein